MPRKVVSNVEWLTAQKVLLAKEKELTRASDDLKAELRDLPMHEVTKPYAFKCQRGADLTLNDLFDSCDQLVMYHFMFPPDIEEPKCPACSFMADHFPQHLQHLRARNTNFVVISRAPIDKLEKFQKRMGWTFPWLSSLGSDFNYDFQAAQDEDVCPVKYNYMDKETLERKGIGHQARGEQPGVSVFYREGGKIYHSYLTYGRGFEGLVTTYTLLDMTPLGRQDGPRKIEDFALHDKYGEAVMGH